MSTEQIDVTVYYLEMRSHVAQVAPPPHDDLLVLHAKQPSVPYYRFLYDAVGKEFHWLSRRKMSDEQLAALLADPRNELHVLQVAGSPAGFAELDRRRPGEIELVQFGLMRPFFGQGLGRWFIRWMVDLAWSYQPERFWLHTCSLDHPAALPNYEKAGFQLCHQHVIRREL